jgi:histidine triad (HIT) family protein
MDCIFCKIATGEVPATIVARRDHAVAFRDLNPQAPTHLLVIPTRHVASLAELDPATDSAVLSPVLALAVEVARQEGLADAGYRLVINNGPQGGQTVPHLHVHLLGGRQMHWPPG